MKNSTEWSPRNIGEQVLRTASRGPNGAAGIYGRSVAGAALRWFAMGRSGGRRVLLTAAHHANEWITAPLLMRFAGELAAGVWPGALDDTRVWFAPLVNPDGVSLVTGQLASGALYENARRIAEQFPALPFPDGWKANIRGVDLNLQYPAGWEEAKEIKYAAGWDRPAPRDYVGSAPLCAPESRALYRLTKRVSPDLVVALHTQGRVIYWRYLDYLPPRSREIADAMAKASGYSVEETPPVSGYAGYKDWFIQTYDRPGYTIEVGQGTSPLPLTEFDALYADNLGILVLGLALAAQPPLPPAEGKPL